MKKPIVLHLVALVALVALFGASPAAAIPEFQVGLKLGAANALGDFGEDVKDGVVYGFYGEVAYSPHFAFEGSIARHSHDQQDEGFGELFTMDRLQGMFQDRTRKELSEEANVTINEVTLNGKYYPLLGTVRPYLTLGVGAYLWDLDIEYVGDKTEMDFGVNAGGGLTFQLTERISLGAEARYNYVWVLLAADDDKLEFLDITGLASYGF